MKNHLFLYALLIITVLLMVGCTPGIPQLPIDNLQGDEADQENQDEATGVPRVVFIELFNTEGCASSKVVNPIMEEIVAEYENTVVILVEEAGWGAYSTEETRERFKWYLSDKSELHTPSVCFDGLNQLFAEGFILSGGGNSGNSGNEDVGDAGDNEDPEIVEVDTTKPVIAASRAPLPNSFGWNNTDVTVSFSCVDTGAVQSGIDINTVAGMTLTTEGKDQSVTNTGECIDAAGNVADPVTVSNINIDKTPPVVTITLPGTGEYALNQSIAVAWSATDALSGVVSPASGLVLIDTSSVGTKTFTLPVGTAKDKAGNSSLMVTISYSVIENTEEPVKWSELGMNVCPYPLTDEEYDSSIDTLLANGFTELRVTPINYQDTTGLAQSKAAVIRTIAKGADVIWGITTATTLTSSNWSDYSDAVLAGAQWAQDNGVYEFQIGNEAEAYIDGDTLVWSQLFTNLKTLATAVQAIFTNGNISYSTMSIYVTSWVAAGKGDIDLLACNIYRGDPSWNYWKTDITNLVSGFGVNGTYLTEINLHWDDIDSYSTDESIQATAVAEMIDYIKASGMTRASFHLWYHPSLDLGVLKDDGTYKLLWSQALLNSDSVKFASVPVKTATASLPNTIALIP